MQTDRYGLLVPVRDVPFLSSLGCPIRKEQAFVSMLGGGCEIQPTEHRGISLVQLRAVLAHIGRRCAAERWSDWQGTLLAAEKVTLYDCTQYVILPFTVQRRCAFVEMVE